MLLLAGMNPVDTESLRQAIIVTFEDRKMHELPVSVPLPSRDWTRPFRKMANEVGLEFAYLLDAGEALRQFIEPPLGTEIQIRWNPTNWRWEGTSG